MRKASSKLRRSFSSSGAACSLVRITSSTAKAIANNTSPTQISAGYIVENQCGSSDIHQWIASKLAVKPRPSRAAGDGNRQTNDPTHGEADPQLPRQERHAYCASSCARFSGGTSSSVACWLIWRARIYAAIAQRSGAATWAAYEGMDPKPLVMTSKKCPTGAWRKASV